MQFRLSCPGCGKSLLVSHADGGKELLCRACGRRVALPPGLGAPGELTPWSPAAASTRDRSPFELEPIEPDVGSSEAIQHHRPDSSFPGSVAGSSSAVTGDPRSRTSGRLVIHWPSALIGLFAGLLLASAIFIGFIYGPGEQPTTVTQNLPSQNGLESSRSNASSIAPPASGPATGPVAVAPITAALTDGLESHSATTQESFVLERPNRATQPSVVTFRAIAAQPTTQSTAAIELSPASSPSTRPLADALGSAHTQPASATQPIVADASQPSPQTQPVTVLATGPAWAVLRTAKPRFRLEPVPLAAGTRTPQQLDQQIDAAIRKATHYLLTKAEVRDPGQFTLASYAAIAAAQATNDPSFSLKTDQMKKLIERLKETQLDTIHAQTYARGIRAAALALTDRQEDRKALEADVRWLIDAHVDGDYTYGDPRRSRLPQIPWSGGDNSNSQYGLLGVWAGAEAGVEVPHSYWQAVESHWRRSQTADGRWGYTGGGRRGSPTITMTCAGIASLLVTYDYLHAEEFVSKYSTLGWPKELTRPLKWLSDGSNALGVAKETGSTGYACYGLERVGLATGFKYFGTHDWYRELAEMMVDSQSPNGAWGRGGDTITASYFVLFLARGRHPVLANKLLHDGSWSNRPRDLANAARFVTKTVERPLNWQVVNLERPGTDWLDAPILYMPSHKPLPLKPEDVDKIRDYIDWGGLVFLHADGGSAAYSQWAETFAESVCRGRKLVDLPAGHPLTNVAYKLPPTMRLKAVSNGSRLLVVLAVDDHAGAWQARNDKAKAASFQLFGNLFAYATGNVPPRNRVDTTYVEPVPAQADHTLTVARLRYDGNWDPEPGAWLRFGRQIQWETGVGVDVQHAVATELPAKATLVHLTGTDALKIDEGQAGALGAYVRGGGVLLIDACGGSTTFGESVEQNLLPIAFPGMQMTTADLTLPPFARSDAILEDVSARKLRPFAASKIDRRARPMLIGQYGKGVVIFSPLDLTTGLLGTHVWGVMGHSPEYSKGVMKNILSWAGTMREP